MEPELVPRVFDLFTQADRSVARSQGGLGIGLTLVRSLVEMHGGQVEARSDGLEQGSEFIVRLPALAESPAPAAPAVRNGFPTPGPAAGRRVLIVDDNQAAAKVLSEIAVRWHHDVHWSTTARRPWRPPRATAPTWSCWTSACPA